MKIKNLKQMKKALLGVITVAIVALAAVNVNLSFNGDSKINATLASIFSVAQNEQGNGNCSQNETVWDEGWWMSINYICEYGFEPKCAVGYKLYEYFDGNYYVIGENINWLNCT